MGKIAIISANYYENVCNLLEDGAIKTLKENNLDDHEIIYVPGAFEIPSALNFAIGSKKYSGFIVLGCVMKGETEHYDFICNAIFHGITKLTMKHSIALGMGVLTVHNLSQAVERAHCKRQNVGGGAALAMIRMIQIKKQLGISE